MNGNSQLGISLMKSQSIKNILKDSKHTQRQNNKLATHKEMRIRMVFDFSSAKLNVTVGEKVILSSKGKSDFLPKYQGQVQLRHIFGYILTPKVYH